MMFDNNNNTKHIGTDIKLSKHLDPLKEVEEYFRGQCNEYGIEVSYDCTAVENPHFKTLNYTSFCGMFIAHPLQFELSFFQMYDAMMDGYKSIGHTDYIKAKHSKGKYTGTGKAFATPEKYNLVVMPGGNKFDTLNWAKLSNLSYEDIPLVLKPHPVSTYEDLKQIKKRIPRAIIAPMLCEVYDLIDTAEKVYTTHVSETALTSLLRGKKVEPVDVYPRCYVGSFSHVTHLLFTRDNPVELIGGVFASEKSGLIHPEVDSDWKVKVDGYLDYILDKRRRHLGYL